MRYEDTSGSISSTSAPEARDDADTLANGSNGPATGNVITGAGTITGKAGADSPQSGHVVTVRGAGGTDTSDNGASLHVDGRFGTLVMDDHGNYKYVADGHAPANFRDLFQYTLADSKGGRSVADLVISRGGEIKVSENAQKVIPGPDGVVTLPAGVDLNDVHVVGRDLVINMPDGSQIVIVDGAVFVPQLVLGGVEVPSTNLAALLIDAEPRPAAGTTQSSGGNFEVPVSPLDPGVPLGDLIPPTELAFTPPSFKEVNGFINHKPTIEIQPDNQPASVAAVDDVNEKGLPTRNGGEPAGSGEIADGNGSNNSDTTETTAGTIIIDSQDTPNSVSINGVVVTGVIGQTIAGDFGTLTITGFNGQNILYSYTLHDNTSGNNTHDDFSVTVTDHDGDAATATLRIDIIDDVPTARPDTDAVAAGTYGPETGNVLTGVGTTSGAAGADTVGADNAHISGVTGFNGSVDNDAAGGFVVNGQYGVLTLQSDGSYSYTRNPGTPGGVNDVFNYTLTDGDGDTSTTTLTISIGDSTPHTGENPTALLDDDALAGGNPGGVGDDPDSANTSGTLAGGGGDGPITFAVQTTGAPAGFTYVSGGAGIVLVQQGGVTVLTITVNATTGAYTVVQNAPIDHAAGGDENNQLFTINYSVTDQDGDSAPGTLTINVDDDTPIAHNDVDSLPVGGVGPETGNVISGAGTAGGLGGPGADSVGADTPGAITALASNNVPANSDTNAAGGFVVVGQYGTLTMQADGSYSYTRTDGSPVGNVQDVFTYTLTDHDGDNATATLTINISDSGPNVGENPTVGLDDDALAGGNPGGVGDDPNAVNTSGTLSGSGGDGALTFAVQTTGAPSGFSYAVQGNGDLWVMQGATHVLTITVNSATGAYSVTQVAPIDHAAGGDENNQNFTINYTVTDADGDSANGTLNISVDDDTPVAHNDADSTNPATDTADGNVITGAGTNGGLGGAGADSVGADTPGAITNLVGFNGSSDNNPAGGFVVTGQYGSLTMQADGSYVYTRNPGTPGGVQDVFTYTLTDHDGDNATATLTITIADNVPTAGNVNVGLDDDALAGGNPGGVGDDPDSVNATGTLPGSGGDGALTFGVLLTGAPAGFTYVSGGAGIVLVQQGGTTVLTITVNSTTGAYSVVQNHAIDHAAGGDENNQAFTINYTVTDSDGDTAPGTISISVDDDTPTVSANAGVQLDDDALAGGNPGGVGDDPNATNTSGTLAHSYGADGAGSIAYLATGAPAGFSYALQGNGDLWVMQGATHVLTLTVNSTTGAYTVTQVAPIDHPAGLDENNVSFTISYNVTDHDGDSATGSIVVNVDDDTPTVSANAAVQLDDDALAGGNPGGIGDDSDATNTSGTLAHSYGADGAGSIAYLTTGAPAGFSYALQGNGDLWVMQGANHVLTLTVNSTTGAYTVTQVAPIDHPAGLDENNVSFTISYNVTDHDGDSATGSIVVNVDDDTPTVSANAAVQLDDDALAGGNPGGVGDDPNATNTSGTLAHSYGADGAGSIAYLTTGAPAGFSYALQGNGDLWVMQGATHVLTLTVNSTTGAYTVTQVAPIDHPAGLDENNVSFTISYNVTDHDGDSATGSIVVNVDDDTPTVSANAAVQLDDDALAGGNPGGIGDVNPDTANTSGTLGHSYGADGAGSMAYLTTGAPAGFSYALQGNGDLWIMQGATHVITLTVNSTTGAYTVTQVAPISHPAGGDENDVSFTVNYSVTDHDGDSATGSIVINVDDDTPTAAIVATGSNVSLDESVGIQVDSNDTTNAGVIALFAGVATPGSDTDLPQYATNAAAIVASTGSSYGADGAGSTGFSLNVSSAGVDSGLNTTDGHDILLFKEGNLIVGRVSGGADNGKAAFAIAIDNTGHISTVEYLSIQHPDGTNPDDSVSIANGAVTATVTLTDSDGDPVSSTPLAIGSHIQFQDSGPVMTAAQNMNIQNSGDVAHTAAFAFNLGADGANTATNDVITNVTGSATVGGVAVQNWTLTPGAENATTASYSFSFDYGIGGGNTAHETGTLVFDKAGGTYTVDLADPIQGVTTILQTATGTLFQGYEFGTSTPDNSQPAISVTQIQDLAGTANDIYVQFTSVAEPSSGTGDNNLEFSNWVPGSDNPAPINGGGDTTWNAGQLFNQVDSWVSTSNSSNGVAGDTIQGGEVLDFSLVQGANPTGILANPSTYAQASSMFLKFDGIGSSEDMIVVLKLYDPNTNTYTTRALMIENSDIIKGPGSGPGSYSSISLDNNDGLVIIESNDYNGAGEHWVIVGAQIAGSDEGLTGSAINLNGAIGAGGGSNTTGSFQAFSTDVSDGPFKISSIGFTTVQTSPQNAQLDFNVTVTDGDGDSITQAISATVTSAVDSVSAATIPAANTTIAPVVLDLNGDGTHFLATDAGVTYNYGHGQVATAWVSPQDGILVNDANHDGNVSASEFVFGGNGVTDLQALSAFDSNHDGQLSSADANFGNFAVWQDANSNGAVDAGELQSLTARGIASISLSSDGISYLAAGGDVQVAGTGSYTRTDGSTGVLADAAFLTESRSATNTVLMGALAAAGLAAESSAAATTVATLAATTALTDIAAQHTQSFAPVALDAVSGTHGSDLLPDTGAPAAPTQTAALHASDAGQAHGLSVAGGETESNQAPTELLQNSGPVQDAGAGPSTAASIIMPAAAQLVAAAAHADVSGAQHNQVIGQVLADALHGGGSGPDIDSVLSSLPSQGGAHTAALEALASQAGAAVPNGDSSAFAGFTAANAAFTMEHMMVHVDAAPTHA